MLFHRGSFIGSQPPITIGGEETNWVCHARLLGVTIDDKLTWNKNVTDLRKRFALKLNLLKKSLFFGKTAALDLFFKVILHSVLHGKAVITWIR